MTIVADSMPLTPPFETPAFQSPSTPPFDIETAIETRKIKTKDGTEHPFRFLYIDSPEKWQEAQEIKAQYHMPLLGQDRALVFNLRGLSLSDWEQVEFEHKIPTWSEEGKPTEQFLTEQESLIAAKSCHLVELATGHKFPGETYADKALFFQKLNPGEATALYLYIQNHLSAFQSGRMLEHYKDILADRAEQNGSDGNVEFSGFESWQKATELPYLFRMHRPCQDYILEFPLKNISAECKLMIEAETKEPEAPLMPKRDPKTRRFIPGETVPDFNDIHWLEKMRAINQKKAILFFNACLPFSVPGSNRKEQYDWIAQRLMGDIVQVKQFIENDLCGYRSRYNSFTNV